MGSGPEKIVTALENLLITAKIDVLEIPEAFTVFLDWQWISQTILFFCRCRCNFVHKLLVKSFPRHMKHFSSRFWSFSIANVFSLCLCFTFFNPAWTLRFYPKFIFHFLGMNDMTRSFYDSKYHWFMKQYHQQEV